MTSTAVHPEISDAGKFTLRFFHPEKAPAYQRRGLTAHDVGSISAALAGVDTADLVKLRQQLRDEADEAARGLLARPAVIDALARLPFETGDTIVALGDSITDDSLSWAHQLELVLHRGRPDLHLRVINAGITGDTVLEAIARFDLVAAVRPNWIIQLLGTNDARRHGQPAAGPLVSIGETGRNFGALAALVAQQTRAHLVRVTPPPVNEGDADDWEAFRAESITWRENDVRAIREYLIAADDRAIDLHAAFSLSADTLLLPDGVHPNVLGQQMIAETVLTSLRSWTAAG